MRMAVSWWNLFCHWRNDFNISISVITVFLAHVSLLHCHPAQLPVAYVGAIAGEYLDEDHAHTEIFVILFWQACRQSNWIFQNRLIMVPFQCSDVIPAIVCKVALPKREGSMSPTLNPEVLLYLNKEAVLAPSLKMMYVVSDNEFCKTELNSLSCNMNLFLNTVFKPRDSFLMSLAILYASAWAHFLLPLSAQFLSLSAVNSWVLMDFFEERKRTSCLILLKWFSSLL